MDQHSFLRVEQCCAAGIDTQSTQHLCRPTYIAMSGLTGWIYGPDRTQQFDLDAVKLAFSKQCNALIYQAAL